MSSSSTPFWIRESATHNEISKFLRETPPRFVVVRKGQDGAHVAMKLDNRTMTLTAHHIADRIAADLDLLSSALDLDTAGMRANAHRFDHYFNQFIRDALINAIDAGDVAAVRWSIERNVHDLEREAPLCRAAALGVLPIVKLLLEYGASVDQRNEFGVSPVWCAAAANKPAVLALLLQSGASPLVELPTDGTSPIFVAARCGAAECVALLADCPAVDVDRPRTGHHDVPLMAAVRHGHIDTVRALCRRGANMLVRCGQVTPLGVALSRRDSRTLAELLKSGRVPQAEVDRMLMLVMHTMAATADLLRVLLAAGATYDSPLPLDVAPDVLLCFIAADLPQPDFNKVFSKIAAAEYAAGVTVAFDVACRAPTEQRFPDSADREFWLGRYTREREVFHELANAIHWPRLRPRFATIAIALQQLGMPVDQTIAIMDASDRYADEVQLIHKWNLACAVKHFKRAT